MNTKEKEALKKKWDVVSLDDIQNNYENTKEASYVVAMTIQEDKKLSTIGVEEIFLRNPVIKAGIIMDIFSFYPDKMSKDLYQKVFNLISQNIHDFDISPYKIDYQKENGNYVDTLHVSFSYTGDNEHILHFFDERNKSL